MGVYLFTCLGRGRNVLPQASFSVYGRFTEVALLLNHLPSLAITYTLEHLQDLVFVTFMALDSIKPFHFVPLSLDKSQTSSSFFQRSSRLHWTLVRYLSVHTFACLTPFIFTGVADPTVSSRLWCYCGTGCLWSREFVMTQSSILLNHLSHHIWWFSWQKYKQNGILCF